MFVASITAQILTGRLIGENNPQLSQIKSLSLESIISVMFSCFLTKKFCMFLKIKVVYQNTSLTAIKIRTIEKTNYYFIKNRKRNCIHGIHNKYIQLRKLFINYNIYKCIENVVVLSVVHTHVNTHILMCACAQNLHAYF